VSGAGDGGGEVERHHGDEGERDRDGQREDGQERRADVEQEEDDDGRDHQRLLHEGAAQGAHRAVDEIGAVVRDLHPDALRDRAREVGEPSLHRRDHLGDAGAGPHHHDPAHRLADAVPLEETAAEVRAEADRPEVLHAHRCAPMGAHRDLLQGAQIPHQPAAAHGVLAAGVLEDPAAHLAGRVADPLDDLLQRDVVGAEAGRVQEHLELLLVPAHARHLGHARHLAQGAPQGEVLERPELVQPVAAARVHQRVLEGPAGAGGVRAERGPGALGELGAGRGEELLHAAPGPVEVGPLLEDHVHEGHPQHRVAAHARHPRRAGEGAHDGVGDLVLDQGRAVAHPLRVDPGGA
jgi:hypothetical protein